MRRDEGSGLMTDSILDQHLSNGVGYGMHAMNENLGLVHYLKSCFVDLEVD